MRVTLIVAVVATVLFVNASTVTVDEAWVKFKADYGKHYKSPMEESARKEIFTDNFNKIQEHNKLYDQGLVNYYLKINQYSDLTASEMQSTLTGFTQSARVGDLKLSTFAPVDGLEVTAAATAVA